MLGSIASHSSKIYIRLQKQCSQQILLLLFHISHFQPNGRGMGIRHHPGLQTTSKPQACPQAGSSPAVQGFCMAEHCAECPLGLIAANCWRTKIQKWPDKWMAVIFPCMAASYLLKWNKQDFAGLWQHSGKSETGKWTEIWPFRACP